jgi:hypothetical protein
VKRELVSYSADRAVPADHAHTRFKQHN